MALPTLVFRWLTEKCSTVADPALSALADLMVLAFFFLFHVGEYITSTPAAQAKKRTIPLWKKDIWLWQNNVLLSNEAPQDGLLTATAVSTSLANQKNGHCGEWLMHH
jgi:hypothetical protein